jgi:NADP-dependent 3-hydroxy acid dehydrogenase YdfG
VADAERAAAAVDDVVTRLGRLDTVVNNAGLMLIGEAARADPADWDKMLSVNVQGLLYVTRASLPHLIAAAADSPRGVADVVNISSTAGRVARPGTAVYALTKFGVGAFSEALRQEVLGQRVRVGLVEPGTVQTEITNNLPAADRASLEQRTADMVKLEPVDIADAVSYMVTRDRRVANQRDPGAGRRADLVGKHGAVPRVDVSRRTQRCRPPAPAERSTRRFRRPRCGRPHAPVRCAIPTSRASRRETRET